MSGASDVVDKTRALAGIYRADIKAAVASVGVALGRVDAADDVVVALRSWGDVALALEALHDLAGETRAKAREWLSTQMSDTGATTIEASGGSWHVRVKPAFVEITGEVPDDFKTTPSPQPDKKLIAAHLKAGHAANWSRLIVPTETTVAYVARKG